MRQTLSVASKVSSVLLKRIWPDQAATPFNLAGFDAPERPGDRKLVSRSFCKRLGSIHFSAGDFLCESLDVFRPYLCREQLFGQQKGNYKMFTVGKVLTNC